MLFAVAEAGGLHTALHMALHGTDALLAASAGGDRRAARLEHGAARRVAAMHACITTHENFTMNFNGLHAALPSAGLLGIPQIWAPTRGESERCGGAYPAGRARQLRLNVQGQCPKPLILRMPAPVQASDWARPGTEAIAALVDLSAAEVHELLAAPDDGLGFGGGGGGGGAPALAQRVAHLLAALEGALARGADF